MIEKVTVRYRSLEPHVRRRRVRRLYALLARKGFDSETIQAALNEAADGE